MSGARNGFPARSSRRRTLRRLGAAAGAAALGSCATTAPGTFPGYPRPLSRGPFVPPRISRDRVVQVIVGLRPYRPQGFVVRRDEMDGTSVIHNYGHGGGGITLSWGSSALAVRLAAADPVGKAAVVGGGVMGLTTARLLQDAGWQVTIYTRDMLSHSTSNVAGGQWAPTSVFEDDDATPEFRAQYRTAARIAHHVYQNLVGSHYGVRFLENYYLGETPLEMPYYLESLPELFTSVADLEPHQHPFPAPYVRRTVTLMIEPAIFLRRVRDDFLRAGGTFEIRNFASRSEVLALPERLVFNCTGLGARALFDDPDLIPAKGQLVFLPPDPAVDFLTVGGGSDVTYMFPRTGEVLLGGSFERDVWSREPDPAVTERIIEDSRALFEGFR